MNKIQGTFFMGTQNNKHSGKFCLLLILFLFCCNIYSQDIFVRVTLSKERVVEQEPVVLTYTVFSKYSIREFEGKHPALSNFTMHELPQEDNDREKTVVVNGKEYKRAVWNKYLIYPLRSGKLEIPSMSFFAKVVIPEVTDDPFEAFFNGGTGYVEKTKTLTTNSAFVEVKSLDPKPLDYSGGVGRFSIEGIIDTTDVETGQPIKMLLTIEGQGNFGLLQEPKIQLPRSFVLIDTKIVDEKIELNGQGSKGHRSYECTFAARHRGEFDIPSVKLIYFDTDSVKYLTKETDTFHLSVTRGESIMDKDLLHDIKTEQRSGTGNGFSFWGSKLYSLVILIVILLFVAIVRLLKKVRIRRNDIKGKRFREAEQKGIEQLKMAKQELENGNINLFYDFVHKALYQYIQDRLKSEQGELTKEKIYDTLDEQLVDKGKRDLFISLLDQCERFKYGNSFVKEDPLKIYDNAVDVIKKLTVALR